MEDEGREPPRLAASLASAQYRDIVYMDGTGQVRPPDQYRSRTLLSYGAIAATTVAVAALGASCFGPYGALAGLAFAAAAGADLRVRHRLTAAFRLVAEGRFDQAEPSLQAVAGSRRAGPELRGLAAYGLGRIAARRGDHAGALGHADASLPLLPAISRLAAQRRLAAHSAILALVNLDRVAEARARFDGLGPGLAGDLVCFSDWLTELYLCLAEGSHALPADELHRRARTALGISSAAALIGLCAWAHAHIGDRAQARHLLAEATERRPGSYLEITTPRLDAWMMNPGL